VFGKSFNTTLPVATVQVGCVSVPTEGVLGIPPPSLFMVTLVEEEEVHLVLFVTAKVYIPAAKPAIVVLIPVPVVVTPSGLRVKVHVPVLGKPFNATLPVRTVHVGCVIVPTKGVLGVVPPVLLITRFGVGAEVQPTAFVTV
jgi:hypothetical protein